MIATLETSQGPLWISGRGDAIQAVSWEPIEGTRHRGELDWILAALDSYFVGKRTSFPGGLMFMHSRALWIRKYRNSKPSTNSQKILCAIERIPYGATMTYGDIAASVEKRNWARAVGAVCRANPLPILVPCHRVVGRSSLGGYSGGIHYKTFLLRLEGSMK